MSDGSSCLKFAYSFSFPEIPNFQLIASTNQDIELLIKMHWIYVGVSMEWCKEFSLLKSESVDFVDWCRNAKIGIEGVILEISWKVGNSSFVMSPILRVEVNGSVVLRHHYLAVVIWEYLELDDLTIESSETFEWEFCSIVYLDLRGVYASSHDVPLIPWDFDLVGRDLELEVLNEFYPPAVLLVITKWFAWFLGLL